MSLPSKGEVRCQDRPVPEVRRPEAERVKLMRPDWEAGRVNSRTGAWRSVAASFDLWLVPLASQSRFPARVISFLDCEIPPLGRVDGVPLFLWLIRFVRFVTIATKISLFDLWLAPFAGKSRRQSRDCNDSSTITESRSFPRRSEEHEGILPYPRYCYLPLLLLRRCYYFAGVNLKPPPLRRRSNWTAPLRNWADLSFSHTPLCPPWSPCQQSIFPHNFRGEKERESRVL